MFFRTIGMMTLGVAGVAAPGYGALFSENFNADVSSSWTVNSSVTTDSTVDFFFDYSRSGIPEAPNSGLGNTPTRGMQLRVNEFFFTFGGFSVSPTGLDLGTGDYTLTFDWWENTTGPFPFGGSGSTQMSQFGVLTSGAASTAFGESSSDGVWFAATGDGGSSADWRAYSADNNISYQAGEQTNGVDVYFAPDDLSSPDPQRNASNPYYAQFGNIAPPTEQTALFSQQTGLVQQGAAGFAWHEVEIAKVGNVVTWTVDNLPIARVDTTNFTVPTGGNNILFGRNDVNSSSSNDVDEALLLFTLIDNIVVVPEPASVSLLGLGALMLLRRRLADR